MKFLALILVPLAFALPALAQPYAQYGLCDSAGQPAVHRVEITDGSAADTYYVDDENWITGNGIWIYQESNTVWEPKLPGVYLEGTSNANLQRGGSSPWIPGDNDICSDAPDLGPDSSLL